MHWIRLAPMTAESLIVCVAIYATCLSQSTSKHKSFADVQRDLGAICPLELSEAHDGMRRAKEPELFGPFDVWDGGWWRIPMTVFHHQDLLHLVLNLGAAWYLGRRLEAGWGSFATGMFLIPAILLPVMAELCLGQPMIGFSGVVCAMLGALVALRQFDVKFADTFSEDAAEIGVALIVLGWLATSCEFVVLPNTAHITGFLYGVLIGGTCGGPFRRVALLRVSVILVHLWVAPGLFLVCHPYWIGRYSWYQAISSRNPQRTERSLERAL